MVVKVKSLPSDLILNMAQMVIMFDIVQHQYSHLSIEDKRKIILALEKAKELNKKERVN